MKINIEKQIALQITQERMVSIADILTTIPEKYWQIIYDIIYSASLDTIRMVKNENK